MIPESLGHLLSAMASVTLVRGTLVFCAACAVMAVAKRLSSEVRHLVWVGVVASFLLIPLAWLVLPAVDVGIPRGPAAHLGLAAAPALSRVEYARVVERTSIEGILTLRPTLLVMNWLPVGLLVVWFAGVLVLTGRLIAGTVRLRLLAGKARHDSHVQSLGDRVAAALSFRGGFRIILSAGCLIPFSFGLFRQAIVLPADADRWPGVLLDAVLTHELSHLRRRDVLMQSAAYALCVFFWFAPPLWLAYAAMLREAETCCDQQVIDRGIRGPEYARGILELVRSCRGRMFLPCTSAALGLKTMMRDRITRVLALRPVRRPFRLRDAGKVIVVCLCCMAPVLALFAQAQAQPLPKNDPLFGTWVNAEYDASPRFDTGKFIVKPDGHKLDYRHIADTKPFGEYWDTVDKAWIDSTGRHWYRLKVVGWCGPVSGGKIEGFGLARISPDGDTIETVFTEYGYPEDVSPLGPTYVIAHRRE
ncbi:MAG: M56 family metallopeptidase [Spirochaetia bacterium]|jgi:beta-lactamase regulating signal transducer with metallopeptidase domain